MCLLASLLQAPAIAKVWLVGQGDIPEKVRALVRPHISDLARVLEKEAPQWMVVDLDKETRLIRPRFLPFVDIPAREVAFLSGMRDVRSKVVKLSDLAPADRQFVMDKLRIIGFGKLNESHTVHLDLQQRTWIDHERGTNFQHQSLGKSAPQSIEELQPVGEPTLGDRPDWPQSNPTMGLTFHFGSSARSQEDALAATQKITDYLRNQLQESLRKKQQLIKDFYAEPLPKSFEELPAARRKAIEESFIESFRAYGYESEDAARLAWANRKGFRSDYGWMVAVTELRKDGVKVIHAVELLRAYN